MDGDIIYNYLVAAYRHCKYGLSQIREGLSNKIAPGTTQKICTVPAPSSEAVSIRRYIRLYHSAINSLSFAD
jgi:hypothetical protein